MGNYAQAFQDLNEDQRLAVTTIDGPVLVIAGPGTGKTQLLSVRVGNILQTDTTMLPSNILCLTFTDSAAANLRERLISKIGLGQEAYKVAIHTFNSFGAWIMSTYPEYFADWRELATADELTSYRLLETILATLPGDHPLTARGLDESFLAIKQIRNFISDAKRANLAPEAIRQILQTNDATYDQFLKIISKHWPGKITDKALGDIHECVAQLEKLNSLDVKVSDITPVATLILQELQAAKAESDAAEGRARTKPFTAWKNNWLELDANKKWVFRASKHTPKLVAAIDIYDEYQKQLLQQGLADFDDQIVKVLEALAKHEELRLNLQERFQYIMIDEYQDTNRAQLQMARRLTDAAVHEGRPNIMVVSDDDQAIYRFQGADMSNIAAFETAYPKPTIIRLKENYRSNQDILQHARSISTQIDISLEKLKGVSKELSVNVEQTGAGTKLYEFEHETEHYAWIASAIQKQWAKKTAKQDIAVLARQRDQLDALVPYLREQGVPIDYERRENVLEQEHVIALLTLARLVHALSEQRLAQANELLPEVLSHAMWDIAPAELWRVASAANKRACPWLDIIFEQTDTPIRRTADFLLQLSLQAKQLPLEHLLDALIGIHEPGDDSPVSPFKQYYFGEDLFNQKPAEYLTLLSHVACLRRHLRNYQQGKTEVLHLRDLIDFVDTYQRAGLVMIDIAPHREDTTAVHLMTAHKAKGQEFDTVYVIGSIDSVWQKNAVGNRRFSYPGNLQEIKPSDNDADDALRLFFVAMTRAKQNLHICYFKTGEDGKKQQPFAPLLALGLDAETPVAPRDANALVAQYEQRWLSRHASVEQADKHALLHDRLQSYRLSATHFSNFLDVSRGGPLFFLTQSLLRFPSGKPPQVCYGIVVHEVLRAAHEQVAAGQPLQPEKLIALFKTKLATQPLAAHDASRLLHNGQEQLRAFLAFAGPGFAAHQKTEVAFGHSGVTIGQARLTGSIDLLTPDASTRTITVTDYKTGKPLTKWQTTPSTTDYDQIKLHRNRQQLLFYKLLVDGSPDWQGWRANAGQLQFVKSDDYGKFHTLAMTFDDAELERTRRLIQAVWHKIMALDFEDISGKYAPGIQGVLQFEDELLAS